MLIMKNIDVVLGKNSRLERQILNNLSLTAVAGEFLVIIGGNGASKFTMLNVISGFIKPDKGKIILGNQDVTNTTQQSRCASIATVMQDPRIGTIENMTIFENMAFAMNRGSKRQLVPFFNRERKNLFQEKLLMLNMGLENRLNDLVANLSGGQPKLLA